MLLSGELAQRIVDVLLPISPYNVNLMDQRGNIIASGHGERIGSFHKGALEAVATGGVIAIYPENINQYPGALPGINMPIVFEEQTIGVVGVSGHPDAVEGTAALVKAVVELVLEREMLRERFRSQANSEEHFLGLLLSDAASSRAQELQRMARMLQINLLLPRLVVVIDIEPLLRQVRELYGQSALVTARLKERLIREVNNSQLCTAEDLVALLDTQLILVKHLGDEAWGAELSAWTQRLADRFKQKFSAPLRVGIGSLCASPFFLYHSYCEALFCLESGAAGGPASIYDFRCLADYLLKADRRLPSHPLVVLRRQFEEAELERYDMKRSLKALMDCQFNVQQAARQLFIHRNTLLFRLEKLLQATALDPCHYFEHAVLCRVLLDDWRGTEKKKQ